jgi:hypothetical protein
MGPYAVVDCNLTLCRRQNRQHFYHREPYVRVDLNPMPESILSPSQPPVRDLGFGPCTYSSCNYCTAETFNESNAAPNSAELFMFFLDVKNSEYPCLY